MASAVPVIAPIEAFFHDSALLPCLIAVAALGSSKAEA
jgi:hypothetical protein